MAFYTPQMGLEPIGDSGQGQRLSLRHLLAGERRTEMEALSLSSISSSSVPLILSGVCVCSSSRANTVGPLSSPHACVVNLTNPTFQSEPTAAAHERSSPSSHACKNTSSPPHALTHSLAFPFLVELSSIIELSCCHGNSSLSTCSIASCAAAPTLRAGVCVCVRVLGPLGSDCC